MYNIKEAAARAGVTVPVLRAWERRYGVVHPKRASSGYRQFDDAAVARVRAMRELVDGGWSPSAAAAAILDGTAAVPGLDRNGSRGEAGIPAGSAALATAESAALAERFVAAAASLDPDAVAAVLDDLFARGSFERVASDLLFPALEALGEAWARRAVSVGGEHMASYAVERRLALAFDAAGSASRTGPRVVVGLPPGSRHVLGAFAFAVAARRAGMAVTYLGADLPVEDWLAATDGAAAALIGVVAPRDRGPAGDVARQLRADHPDLVVAFGGRAAQRSIGFPVLPENLAESVAAVAQAIEARTPA